MRADIEDAYPPAFRFWTQDGRLIGINVNFIGYIETPIDDENGLPKNDPITIVTITGERLVLDPERCRLTEWIVDDLYGVFDDFTSASKQLYVQSKKKEGVK